MDWSSFFIGAVAGVLALLGTSALLVGVLCVSATTVEDAHPYMPEAEGTQLGGEG